MQVENLTKQFLDDFPKAPDEDLDTYTLRAREIAEAAISNFQGDLLDAALEISKALVNFAVVLQGPTGDGST